ncbi:MULTISPECIES: aromatic-ring-hydroxylating dioxygenase subunit beta [Cupriavidus]
MSSITRDPALALPAATKASIDRLMARYASAIDNGEYEVWPTLFTEDGVYRITTRTDYEAGRDFGVWYCNNRGMLEDRVQAIRGVNIYEPHVYRHMTGPVEVLSLGSAEARCETSYLVVRTDVDGDMTVFSAGRYVDHLVFDDGQAQLRSRVVVADSARFDTLVALPI